MCMDQYLLSSSRLLILSLPLFTYITCPLYLYPFSSCNSLCIHGYHFSPATSAPRTKYLSAIIHACLTLCLSICLPLYLSAYLPAGLPICLLVCQSVSQSIYQPGCLLLSSLPLSNYLLLSYSLDG